MGYIKKVCIQNYLAITSNEVLILQYNILINEIQNTPTPIYYMVPLIKMTQTVLSIKRKRRLELVMGFLSGKMKMSYN